MSSSTISAKPLQLLGYTLGETLYQGSRTTVYQALAASTQQPVVVKVLSQEHPSFAELVQFCNQYEITKNLSITGIVPPLCLEPCGNGYALVMEDFAGVDLGQYIRQSLPDLSEVLTIALQLAEILHELHQHRVIHKDIKPANILIHPESKQVKLIDFSIASLLPKETQTIQSPDSLEGTLAYLAPEQTGRMNRAIDYRTDFYALGVTLYELLTGRLPFISDDPLELIHCHMAQLPTAIEQVNPDIPVMVSKIVAKLMAKNTEDRYQGALGLKHDLEQCLTQVQEQGAIAEFELGQRDVSDRFLIPEKLYGREAEIETLLDAFERVSQGASELMLVAGFSGIGKTAVVNEVHKPIVRQRGYFIKGKFDQFNRNIPFSAFVQAFRDLVNQLLSESDRQLQNWQQQILAALGENAQVIIDLIPELSKILGPQPPASVLSGTAAQNRFNLLFQKFIQVFTTPEHPLVIFVDDLQWADAASLNLIHVLMGESQASHLLVLGAYRDNEVFPAHPLMLTLEELRSEAVPLHTVTLQPLETDSLNHLIADAFHTQAQLVEPLTNLIRQKTQGNPFFATQFLKVLHEDQLITFDADARHWQCDITKIREAALTDDVVTLMALQLQKLPAATQEVLQLAACIGAQFDLETIAIVSDQSQVDTAAALWPALQEGLIVPQSDLYKFYLGENQPTQNQHAQQEFSYRFLHDRVQQAAYSLIDQAQKAATHWHIGTLLLQGWSAKQDDKIFDLVNQLNLGKSVISQSEQIQQLTQLNLQAAQKAKLSAAYNSTQTYCETGIALLTVEAWETHYDLMYALHYHGSEAAYLSGQFERAESLYADVLRQARTPLEKAAIYRVQMTQYQLQGRNAEAIAIQRQSTELLGWTIPTGLDQIGASLDAEIATVTQFLEGQTITSILELPKMTDATTEEMLRILQILLYSAWLDGQTNLALLAVAKMTTLSLQYGNSEMSPFGYVGYGLVSNAVLKNPAQGHEFGDMAVQLCDQFDNADVRSMTSFLFAADVHSWKRPLREADQYYESAYKYGMDAGNWLTVSFVMMLSGSDGLTHGKNLEELYSVAQAHATFLQQIKSLENLDALTVGVLQPIRQLLGLTVSTSSFDDDQFSEAAYLQKYQDTPYHLAWYYSVKIRHAYLFEQIDLYPDLVQKLDIIESTIPTHAKVPSTVFYTLLMHLALIENINDDAQKAAYWQVSQDLETKLKQWQQDCPENVAHKYWLVQAEKARLQGQRAIAIDCYEQSITQAQTHGYGYEAALANELAAKFYLGWDKEKVAAGYMKEAYYGYALWGAQAKTTDLETRYPHLLRSNLQSSTTVTSILDTLMTMAAPTVSIHSSNRPNISTNSLNQALDFATILRASQTLSSTIQQDELLRQLTQIILQNSGGDRCALLLPASRDSWQVRAFATPESVQLCTEPLENNPALPVKLIQYVKNTQEVVVIDDLETDLPVIDDYLKQRQPKSVLCLPILNQGHLIGILYLKNRLTSGVFNQERILILNFLCTQAAISIQNSLLYKELETSLQQAQNTSQELAATVALSKGQQHILALIAQGLPLTQILEETALYIESQSRHPAYCSLLILDADGRLRNGAAPSLPSDYNALIDGLTIGPQVGSCGTAAYCKASVTVTDIATDPLWANFQVALDFGLRACASTPILGAEGQVLATLAMYQPEPGPYTLHDRQLMELAIDLARIAIERHQADIELQQLNLQMIQGEKMATLGNLVAGVAHEINNPIGFLNGSIKNTEDYVQDLFEHLATYQELQPPNDEVQESAEEVELDFLLADLPKLLVSMKGATDRIKAISNSLRTFSRADTENQVRANLHEGLDSTLLILKYRLKANDQRPAIEVVQNYGDLPEIECFPGQLNQVFMNILANAIDMFDEMAQQTTYEDLKNTPQQITIKTAMLADKNAVELRIADNGEGISDAVKSKIFNSSFTTKEVGKGTGLGLAIARQIVEEVHDGTLEVQSQVGQGTEFCICLPS
ncbi:MAG: AAA family ATPase [Leptolyngbya sp. SIOISBB]|nr:AAA family ATPase [Leptolyngbya sp. SIOISBB]